MNTIEAIKTRRSTRKFKAQPVEIEKLKAIAEAGQFGPTGGNAQGNHFFVISDASVIAKLKELVPLQEPQEFHHAFAQGQLFFLLYGACAYRGCEQEGIRQ